MTFYALYLGGMVDADCLTERFDRDENVTVFVDFGVDFNAVDDGDFCLLMF